MTKMDEPQKAVILASGGLDSTVAAAVAREEGCELFLLTIRYGQRHLREVDCARAVARWLKAAQHTELSVDLKVLGGSALTSAMAVPKDRLVGSQEQSIPATYVPARNMIFLSLALAFAEVQGAGLIYFGANIRDYSGYPDCRPEFLDAFSTMAKVGTKAGLAGKAVEIRAPLLHLTKAEIIKRGASLNIPFRLTHSCYDPDQDGKACGQCDSCQIRKKGFEEAGILDEISYRQ